MRTTEYGKHQPSIALVALFFIGLCMIGVGIALLSMGLSNRAPTQLKTPPTPVEAFNYSRDVESGFDAERLGHLVKFFQVHYDPAQSDIMRQWIVADRGEHVRGKTVYEVETGTGYLSLYCELSGAEQIIGADLTRMAVTNAQYNNMLLKSRCRFLNIDFMQHNYFSHPEIIDQRFDVIIACPSWYSGPATVSNEPSPARTLSVTVLANIIRDAGSHINEGGRLMIAYRHKEPLLMIEKQAPMYGWNFKRLDSRDLSTLEEEFESGMLYELTRKSPSK